MLRLGGASPALIDHFVRLLRDCIVEQRQESIAQRARRAGLLGALPGNSATASSTINAVLDAPKARSANGVWAALSPLELRKNWSNPPLLISCSSLSRQKTTCSASVSPSKPAVASRANTKLLMA